MAQSLAQMYIHVVFSTKNRHPFIDSEIESELFTYIGGVIKGNGGIPLMINGMPDHIHVFSTLPRTIALSKFIEDFKRSSSRWIKTKDSKFKKFAWQNGYAAFSVSSSKKDAVMNYIANQKEHHKVLPYKDEVLKFLKEYDVDYKEEYLWD